MKISADQARAALQAYVTARKDGRSKKPRTANPGDGRLPVDALQRRLGEMPEERALLVRGLRAKVLRGRYHVSSADIANALLGRLTADLLAQD